MNEKKNFVGWDIETTSLDKEKCSILQVAFIKYDGITHEEIDRLITYVKPDKNYVIEEGAFGKHGLTKELIEREGVLFESIADKIIEFCEGCDLITYNGNNFDVPILNRHFIEVGKKFPFAYHESWDAFRIEQLINSHKLENTYARYFGEELIDAHDAGADVRATVKVFFAQLERYNIEQKISNGEIELNKKIEFPNGFFKRNSDGKIEYSIGKYKGKEFMDVVSSDLQYVKWSVGIQNDDVKKILQDYFLANR